MTQSGAATAAPVGAGEPQIKVMIVDDSAVIRAMIAKFLGQQPRIKVAATVPNGKVALDRLAVEPVDVVILDIEMPVMDGLEALPRMIAAVPGIKVIMASTLTLRGASISLEALQKGAADFVPKPTSTGDMGSAQDFARELTEKVLAIGGKRVRSNVGVSAPSARAPGSPAAAKSDQAAVAAGGAKRGLYGAATVVLRQASKEKPAILAIGSSTGGPQALFTVFSGLGQKVRVPVLVTQHMPPHFTQILAEHLSKASGLKCAEAVDGEPLLPGRVYVAPGDFHMVVDEKDGQKVLRTNKLPPENFCRPAVDPMLRSIAKYFGGKSLVCILTGMGQDGMLGGREIVKAGGTVVAQDEPTSVVWGMPGAVSTNGLCSAVLPLERVAGQLRTIIGD